MMTRAVERSTAYSLRKILPVVLLAVGCGSRAGDEGAPAEASALAPAGEDTATSTAEGTLLVDWDTYGGSKNSGKSVPGTGYFTLKAPGSQPTTTRWWLYTPLGNPIFIMGVNSVLQYDSVNNRPYGMHSFLTRNTPENVAAIENNRLSWLADTGYHFNANLGFGNRWFEPWNKGGNTSWEDNPINTRMNYGVNLSVAASKTSDYVLKDRFFRVIGDENGDPHGTPLGDPFNPAYKANLVDQYEKVIRPDLSDPPQGADKSTDPRLIMYFTGNEIGFLDHPGHEPTPGMRDWRRWIWSSCAPDSSAANVKCARHALEKFLSTIYDSIGALNSSWGRSYGSFAAVIADKQNLDPGGENPTCSGNCATALQKFIYREFIPHMIDTWVSAVRVHDTNHLVASSRLATHEKLDANDPDDTTVPNCWWSNSTSNAVWNQAGCREKFADPKPNGRNIPPNDPATSLFYNPWPVVKGTSDHSCGAGTAETVLKGWDVIAMNNYPRRHDSASNGQHLYFDDAWIDEGMKFVSSSSGLPVIVSEFGFRAQYNGWTNQGGAGAWVNGTKYNSTPNSSADVAGVPYTSNIDAQTKRGESYKHLMAKWKNTKFVLGASVHRWADHYDNSDCPEGSCPQMNMGVVSRDGTRYDTLSDAIRSYNRTIYSNISGSTGW